MLHKTNRNEAIVLQVDKRYYKVANDDIYDLHTNTTIRRKDLHDTMLDIEEQQENAKNRQELKTILKLSIWAFVAML